MNIIISGYYGFDNIGDEAVLLGLITRIKAEKPDAYITVLSANPKRTEELYGVHAINRNDRIMFSRMLKDADLFISGGGSLIQDVTSWRSPLYYLYVIHLALKFRVRSVIVCQGVGPLRRNFIRKWTKKVLNRLPYISLRDEDSATLLKEIGVTSPQIVVASDPALTFEVVKRERIDEWWEENIGEENRAFGVALRGVAGVERGKFLEIIKTAAEKAKEKGEKLVFIPFFYEQDAPFIEELTAEVGLEANSYAFFDLPSITPTEMMYFISKLNGLLAVRLHAIIFAAVTKTPTVALSYDPKVKSFCESVDISTVLDINVFSANDLSSSLASPSVADSEKVSLLREKTIAAIKATLRQPHVARKRRLRA